MNVKLDLSKAQLSKLRNGHGVRITPAVVGRGVDLIIDPMTYHNMAKKLDKGLGVIIKMGSNEIEMNKMEGTGLFAGSGNKSGKINRFKKAEKWRDFSVDTLNDGLDLGKRGLDLYQQATSPFKRLFGGEMEGGNILGDIKNAYNKNIKNTKVGSALRGAARNTLDKGYDFGSAALSKSQYTRPLGELARNTKERNLNKAMQLSGLGLVDDIKNVYNKKVKNTKAGDAIRGAARSGLNIGYDAGTKFLDGNKYTKPIATIGRNSKQGNINQLMKMSGLGLKLSQGNGLTMGRGMCMGCGNDKFIFADQSL